MNHVIGECPYAPTTRTLCSLFLFYGVVCGIHFPGLLMTLILWSTYVNHGLVSTRKLSYHIIPRKICDIAIFGVQTANEGIHLFIHIGQIFRDISMLDKLSVILVCCNKRMLLIIFHGNLRVVGSCYKYYTPQIYEIT